MPWDGLGLVVDGEQVEDIKDGYILGAQSRPDVYGGKDVGCRGEEVAALRAEAGGRRRDRRD